MKLRSLVLLGCMLLVPSLAMFSHLIPPDFRSAVRRRFASATSSWLDAAVAGAHEPVPSPPAPVQGKQQNPTHMRGSGPSTTTTGFMNVASEPGSAVGPPAAAGRPSTGSRSDEAPVTAEPVPPVLVAQLADRTRQVRDQQARDQQAIEQQLKALGAVSFDCLPPAGPAGLHSSTCRVPVDATGQLQRVFQATGHDAGSASAALLEQVLAWRQRVAPQPPSAKAGGVEGVGALPADRFR